MESLHTTSLAFVVGPHAVLCILFAFLVFLTASHEAETSSFTISSLIATRLACSDFKRSTPHCCAWFQTPFKYRTRQIPRQEYSSSSSECSASFPSIMRNVYVSDTK
ncbi:hypothetical protein DQ04_03201030 [Trypanosoma grayi]|uniref:hypothetical protein n=1 Tax=Trypanosoma grayi TaxID=71804 RepID=UPI0004F3EFE5|nr:hypothetical protein DQ04_03201030 [Trypanosoma grayi]KEG10869.1 hypothetical protein DQ04_03201030 [Trypanosoma grayi]